VVAPGYEGGEVALGPRYAEGYGQSRMSWLRMIGDRSRFGSPGEMEPGDDAGGCGG